MAGPQTSSETCQPIAIIHIFYHHRNFKTENTLKIMYFSATLLIFNQEKKFPVAT